MKLKLFWVLSLACAFVAVQGLTADDKKEFAANCPVSGGKAKEASTRDYEGKKVYFCCDNCPKSFDKDPEKFASKVHVQWLQTDQIIQVACPISGEDVDPDTAVEFKGTKVAFCCNNCKKKFEDANDDKKIELVFADLDKGFTLQTTCPVSGKPIKTDQVVEADGENVYFCCGNCPAAFKADPDKFKSKLPQFAEKKDK
jgi:YHS domain-containing protein